MYGRPGPDSQKMGQAWLNLGFGIPCDTPFRPPDMPIGKLIKRAQPGQQAVYQQCLMTRQKSVPAGEATAEPLWVLLDPETNNVLADGVDTSFLRQEIKSGRLEAEAGWDED